MASLINLLLNQSDVFSSIYLQGRYDAESRVIWEVIRTFLVKKKSHYHTTSHGTTSAFSLENPPANGKYN